MPFLDWWKPSELMPDENETVLIVSSAVGLVTDVACYLGRGKDGAHRWLLTNVDIDPNGIVAWARVPLPAWLDDDA